MTSWRTWRLQFLQLVLLLLFVRPCVPVSYQPQQQSLLLQSLSREPCAFIRSPGPTHTGLPTGSHAESFSRCRAFPFSRRSKGEGGDGAADGRHLGASQQQPQQHTDIDLNTLLGVPSDASRAAITARSKELEQKLQQLAEVGSAPVDPLLLSLVREVAAVLGDPDEREAFNCSGQIRSSLFDILQLLPAPIQESEPASEADADTGVDEVEPEEDEDAGGAALRLNPLADLFSALHGDGASVFSTARSRANRRRASQPQRGTDVETDATVEFADAAVRGALLKLTVDRLEPCGDCKGSGGVEGRKPTPCKGCDGQGMKTESRRSSFGFVTMSSTCPDCRGAGQLPPPRCANCSGHGRVQSTANLKVSVPAGVDDGAVLTVEGQGNAGKGGGPRGDVYITVHVKRDPRFRREGADIYSQETVSLSDAALGCTKRVQTVDGEAELNIPPNSQSGQRLVIKGRGAAVLEGGRGERGDHVVELKVELPQKLSEEERQLLRRLRDLQRREGEASG